jgi:predicted permease
LVSGSYFPALRLVPTLGRLLTPEDDRVEGGHAVVVVSHAYWTTRLGAEPAVVESTITLNGEPMTIVGIAPEGFAGTVNSEAPAFFVPLAMARIAGLRQDWNGFELRNDHWLYVSARRAPNVSRAQAEQRLGVQFASITREIEFPALRGGMGTRDREAFLARQIRLEEGARGRSPERAEAQLVGTVLFIITGLVLAIAAANVANLLLARGTDRASELAIRQALGASSTRLIRLLLLEAVGLGLVGGLLGLVVARGALAGLVAMLPPTGGARVDAGLNLPVLLFSLSLGLVTGLMFGLFPAVQSTRTGAAVGLQVQLGRASSPRTVRRARTLFATVQIALATTLLSQAGLFVLSLVNIARADTGMRRDGLVMFTLSPGAISRTTAQNEASFEEIEASLRGTPGVLSVSASNIPVLAFNGRYNNVTIGDTTPAGSDRQANYAEIGPEYFATVGIPLLLGREFTRADDSTAPKVAIVNEAFLRKFGLDASVLGMRMARGEGDNRPLDIEIVGVVADARYSDVREAPPPQFFVPYRQGAVGPLTFYVRVEPSSARVVLEMVPAIVSRVEPNLLLTTIQTMNALLRQTIARERVLSTLSLSFAGLATFLTAVGLYAVLAYGVARRAREIGIRLALGATPKQVATLVFGDVGRMILVGSVFGGAVAIALGRISRSILFGLSGDNIPILLGAFAVVLTVALAAGALPARRAARVNPAQTLRAE